MGCCASGGASEDVRGRRVFFIVLDNMGREVFESLEFREAQQAMIDAGGGATMVTRKRFPG